MRPVGFSTGALARSDFAQGFSLAKAHGVPVVELSSLRLAELEPLVNWARSLEVEQFAYVSVHAPGSTRGADEKAVVQLLRGLADRGWPVVAHPDALREVALWRALGPMLCLENMDARKRTGRTAGELFQFFEQLPQARLCLDIGHARQVDRAMAEGRAILERFGDRLAQVHVSEVEPSGKHASISPEAAADFRQLAGCIAPSVPIVIESPVGPDQMSLEIARARQAFA